MTGLNTMSHQRFCRRTSTPTNYLKSQSVRINNSAGNNNLFLADKDLD